MRTQKFRWFTIGWLQRDYSMGNFQVEESTLTLAFVAHESYSKLDGTRQ